MSSIFKIFFLCWIPLSVAGQTDTYLNAASDLIDAISKGEDHQDHLELLTNSNLESLEAELDTDAKKYAFWINVYNSFIQIELRNNPEFYNKRNKFFNREVIHVGGQMLSFSDVEHGILRRSEWLIGLGYIKNPFPSSFKKKMRPNESDYRIHFALNCGAKSCPPVAVYDYKRLDEQLQKATELYLPQYTTYDQADNKVTTTPLFSWFRGDFSGKKGIKRILLDLKIIPDEKVKLKFDSYDWSLFLDNFIEL